MYDSRVFLKQLVLKRHIRLGLQTNTSTEDVRKSATLFGQSVDNGSTRRSQWCLTRGQR